MTHRPCGPERGSGVLSTIIGLGVFLTLLTFCSHVLLNLWVTTSVEAVAHDAANDVATSGASDEALPEVERQALTRARAALGRYGERVGMHFVGARNDAIALEVDAPGIDLVPLAMAHRLGIGGLHRVITISREETGR